MKTQNNNGTLILFTVLGIAGLYYLFSRKSEKKDNTYQVVLPSNADLSTRQQRNFYDDYLKNKQQRTKELIDAGEDWWKIPIQ